MMITGDGNLVDIQAVLRYRVTDPHVFLFDVAGADEILRASAEATLRGLVAGRPFHTLLTVERQKFQDEVLSRLRETCSAYGEKGLGVELESLSLLDLHPPGEVVEAYYDVAKAMERRDKFVNQAQEVAIKWNKAAQAEGEKILSQAKAAAAEKTYAAAAETRKFLDQSRARRELSEHQELQLALDTAGMTLRGENPEVIEKTIGDRRKKLVANQATLTDFRTFWETIGQALSGRSMVLVDSDNVRGQRNLFLIDPDVFRPMIPFMKTAPPTRPLEP
jgi:membrane protease subunit HflK